MDGAYNFNVIFDYENVEFRKYKTTHFIQINKKYH